MLMAPGWQSGLFRVDFVDSLSEASLTRLLPHACMTDGGKPTPPLRIRSRDDMSAKIIEFPGNTPQPGSPDEEGGASPSLLKPSLEMDRQLDRALRRMDKDDPVRNKLMHGEDSIAFSNVFRLLRRRPEELVVFCNTLSEACKNGVHWGDVFCLMDAETYRYIFTLYTDSYVRECRLRRGEVIEASPENIILPVRGLTIEHLTQGVEKWVRDYYPGLTGVPIRPEDLDVVQEMIRDSMKEDPS